jgi:hypothetical protein
VRDSWNATVSQSGAAVTATNVAYNAAVPAGGSTTWGLVVNGDNQALSNLTCTPR